MLSVADLQLAQYLSGDLDSLGLANTKEEHQTQINQGCRAYTHTHMMYWQALEQDQICHHKLRCLKALQQETHQQRVWALQLNA